MKHYFQNKSLKLGKRERTRSALIDSTIEVISRKGFENASIKEIAENAGMANGTFYNHFETREEIAAEAVASILAEISSRVFDQVADVEDGLERIVLSSDIMINHLLQDPDWGAVMVGALPHLGNAQKDVTLHMRQDLLRAKSQGQIHIEINWLLEAQIVHVVSLGLSEQLRNGPSSKVRSETGEAVLRLLGSSQQEAAKLVARVLEL